MRFGHCGVVWCRNVDLYTARILAHVVLFRVAEKGFRSGTSHTMKQGGLKIVCGTTNIMRLGWYPSLYSLYSIHNIGICDGSLTTMISRGRSTQSQPFNANNAVLDLQFVWLGVFPTKLFHLSPLLKTSAPSPKGWQSFHVKLARLRTSRWQSPNWLCYTNPTIWDGGILQCRILTRGYSTSSSYWRRWLGPPCLDCCTPTIKTLLFYCRHQPGQYETQTHPQTKTYCTWPQCQKPWSALSNHCRDGWIGRTWIQMGEES